MNREKFCGEDAARQDLGSNKTKPHWLENQHSWPFKDLSSDEFEILCYLLLLKENPESYDDIFYYGKTGDAGRDILYKKEDGSIELIQCKRYTQNVGLDKIKTEIAKLFVNIDRKAIPERPNHISFYVVPDLTSPALDFITTHSKWFQEVEQDIRKQLKLQPNARLSDSLMELGSIWSPTSSIHDGLKLTERIRKYDHLLEEFFAVRKVFDTASLEPLYNKFDKLYNNFDKLIELLLSQHKLILQSDQSNAPKNFQDFLGKLEQENSSFRFTAESSYQETIIAIQPKLESDSGIYGKLVFHNTDPGKRGKTKFIKEYFQEGRNIQLFPGEYEWRWASNISLPPVEGTLDIYHILPQQSVPVRLECLQEKKLIASVEFTYVHFTRLGSDEIEFEIKDGQLAGSINIVVNFVGKPLKFIYNASLGSVTATWAKQTVLLILAIFRGKKIQLRSLEFDQPLVIGSSIMQSSFWEERLQENLCFLDWLIKINDEFNLDIRYPSKVDSESLDIAEQIVTAIEHGKFALPNKVIKLILQRQEILYLMEDWQQNNPIDLQIKTSSLNFKFLGYTIPMGDVKLIVDNPYPTVNLSILDQRLKQLQKLDEMEIEVKCDRVIYELANWSNS